jgi:uncharacterized protein YprB with RNaseH-like and TPR domain
MELEDKLKRIARFNPKPIREITSQKAEDRIVELLNGTLSQNEFGEFVLVEKKFDRDELRRQIGLTSHEALNGKSLIRICSPRKPGIKEISQAPFDLKEAVFFDCETTGLAGGVGTYAFLVGLGYLSGDEFRIEQYFMQDFHQERAILSAIAEKMSGFKFLVSFNGKCYDLPLLETRWTINRIDFDSDRWFHFDLLFPSRRLWKRRIEDCSLSNIEQKVLNVGREIDVPSFMIPQIYFDYIRTGQTEALIPVFYHNSYDILSILKLAVRIDRAMENFSSIEMGDPIDLYCLGRIHQKMGNYHVSIKCYELALSGKVPPEWQTEIKVSLAFAHKRNGYPKEAAKIWQNLTEEGFPFSLSAHEELAKYYEHKEKDYLKALLLVEQAISRLGYDPPPHRVLKHQAKMNSLEHRKSRLKKKIQKSLTSTAS